MALADERLRAVRGAQSGSVFEVRDELIFEQRARFYRTEQARLIVEDLRSATGTFVNGRAITGPRLLRLGDQIELGETTLVYEEAPGGAPAVVVPPRAAVRHSRAVPVAIAAAIAVAALAGAFVVGRVTKSTSPASPVSAPAAASGYAGTVYIESNRPGRDANSVLAYRYRADGSLYPLAIAEYPTGGSGAMDTKDSGVLDADQHLLYSVQRHLLFAVNQGSDTIAVFHVHGDGTLAAVAGSPFPSGGKGPASIGLSGDIAIVANKASDGIRDLTKVKPSYATFLLHDDGALTPTGFRFLAPAGSQPTQALVSNDGKVVITSEVGGPFRAFALGRDGRLTPGPPVRPPRSLYPSIDTSAQQWGLGLADSPRGQLMYAQLGTINSMAVYRYDDQGRLTFVTAVPDHGGELPCWTIVNAAGTRAYTDDAGNNTVSAYDTSDPTAPRLIQVLHLADDGNPWDGRLDPTGRHLFVVDPRARLNVSFGEGQELHVLDVGRGGRLSERPHSAAPIPVAPGTQPFGVAVAARF